MHLEIVILEYDHDAFLHGCLRNEKLHTPSIRDRQTVAKHTNILITAIMIQSQTLKGLVPF